MEACRMRKIRNNWSDKKNKFFRALKKWWFRVVKLNFMRKRIRKILYKEQTRLDCELSKIGIYASDFKKLSKEQIDYGLNLFIKRGELKSFEFISKNDNSKDEYILVLPVENRSQERFSERTIKEINLNDLHLEPPKENTSAESNSEPTEQTSEEHAEQSSEPTEPKQEETTTPQAEDKPF